MPITDLRYPNLKILNLLEEADRNSLLFLLFGIPPTFGKEPSVFQPVLKIQGKIISRLLLSNDPKSLKAKTAIIESDYIDRDTNIAYYQLYARAFRDYPRRTIRLHFFRETITSFDSLMDSKSSDNYIGYSVLSPTRPGTFGRTILPPPKGDDCWFFATTQSEFSANLSGAQLKAKGSAFAEQDGRVAACASAATWISTVVLAKRFNYDMPVRSMAEITQLATKYSLPASGRGTSPGLNVEQILWALQEMGYDPFIRTVYDPAKTTELIYGSVESGIPPILVIYLPEPCGYHAVSVVGHTYDSKINPADKITKGIRSSTIWCPHFLVHDDQIGPYLKFSVGDSTPNTNGRPSLLLDENYFLIEPAKDEIIKWYKNASIHYIISPFPPRHILGQEQALIKAQSIFLTTYKIYGKLLGLQCPDPPIYRTYFLPSNEYRNHFLSERIPGLSNELAHWYRGSVYPRYIWVAELCALEHRNLQEPDKLRIMADVTIDPTSSPFSQDFVTLHLPGLFFRMSPQESEVLNTLKAPSAVIKDDTPYQPYIRNNIAQPPVS